MIKMPLGIKNGVFRQKNGIFSSLSNWIKSEVDMSLDNYEVLIYTWPNAIPSFYSRGSHNKYMPILGQIK